MIINFLKQKVTSTISVNYTRAATDMPAAAAPTSNFARHEGLVAFAGNLDKQNNQLLRKIAIISGKFA